MKATAKSVSKGIGGLSTADLQRELQVLSAELRAAPKEQRQDKLARLDHFIAKVKTELQADRTAFDSATQTFSERLTPILSASQKSLNEAWARHGFLATVFSTPKDIKQLRAEVEVRKQELAREVVLPSKQEIDGDLQVLAQANLLLNAIQREAQDRPSVGSLRARFDEVVKVRDVLGQANGELRTRAERLSLDVAKEMTRTIAELKAAAADYRPGPQLIGEPARWQDWVPARADSARLELPVSALEDLYIKSKYDAAIALQRLLGASDAIARENSPSARSSGIDDLLLIALLVN